MTHLVVISRSTCGLYRSVQRFFCQTLSCTFRQATSGARPQARTFAANLEREQARGGPRRRHGRE